MHELAIARSMVSLLDKEVSCPEVGRVRNIYLEVGILRYIVPEILETCFKNIPKNEKLNGARIVIETVPVRIICSECGFETEVTANEFICGRCSGREVEMRSGKEFNIRGIEW